MKKKIDISNYKRKGMFEAFKDRDMPYLSTTSHVDIKNLKPFIDNHKYGFFISISYLISKAVNLIPELRHRIIDGELYEYDRVDPGYTVLLEDETFSFCDSCYFEDFQKYSEYSSTKINEVKAKPDNGVGEKHHMFFITNIPWFSFTSIVHPHDKVYASIPIITIGKYFKQGDQLLLPIGIQVHHGVVDGIHLGKFYTHLSNFCADPALWLV
ncbi:chloramphenicol acetyltransferase [Desulfotalea psychrophila]|uniref:Related to chloramphenicol acetyltransferase n=1 Tax=Desulfotalea psychrophila (strain LSv54 / DSM 12343) TaxID=177439 RepID=Q6ALI8_DESPS|nr:chloramphenicol acetyltransferase [Desulfotalea psychrophila]CAG36787.1 related to chloramphenicol acetyltransferase [Desulfotalea psychrophila LSv54]